MREQVGELATEQAQDFDLYDLAPVGCCTVSEAGEIMHAERVTPDGQRLSDALARLPPDEGVRRAGDPLAVPGS